MIAPRNRLTFVVALIAGSAALAAAVIPAFTAAAAVIAALLAAVALIDALTAARSLTGISVETPALIRTVRNRSTRLPFSIVNKDVEANCVRAALELPDAFHTDSLVQEGGESLGRAQRFDLSAVFESPRRGQFRITSAFVSAESKFGLWSARKTAPVDLTVRVYPNLTADPTGAEFLKRTRAGSRLVRLTGKGREFEKLREYSHGDSYDEIAWKATARRGKPVVRVFQVERTQEIYVAMDASRLSARPVEGQPTLEHYVTSALTMGLAAEAQGDRFGLITFSDRLHKFVPAHAGKRHFTVCRDAIYRLQPRLVEPDFGELFAFIQTRLTKRALVVILTVLDDPLIGETFARFVPIVSRRHLVMAAMIRPEGARPLFEQDAFRENVAGTDEIYGQLGGHLRWRKLFELITECRRKGVMLHLLNTDRIAGQLTNLYLDVKRRQQL